MGNSVPTISVALVLGALILKGTDFFKYLVAAFRRDSAKEGFNGLVTLMVTAVAGVVVVFVFKGTQWAAEITIGKMALADLNFWSSIVLGVVASSFGSVLYDYKKAIDNKDTARCPRLVEHEGNREARPAAVNRNP